MGSTQLMSVPYALTSATSADNVWDVISGVIAPISGAQDLFIPGDVNIWGNANFATLQGNVGIGTSNPIRGKLEIYGKSTMLWNYQWFF